MPWRVSKWVMWGEGSRRGSQSEKVEKPLIQRGRLDQSAHLLVQGEVPEVPGVGGLLDLGHDPLDAETAVLTQGEELAGQRAGAALGQAVVDHVAF